MLTSRQLVGVYDQTFEHRLDWGLGFIINSAEYGRDTVPYGYGPYASKETFGHGGNQICIGMADPKYGLVIAVIFNGLPGQEAHQKRMNATLGAIYEIWVGKAIEGRVGPRNSWRGDRRQPKKETSCKFVADFLIQPGVSSATALSLARAICFDLADAMLGEAEAGADLFVGVGRLLVKAEMADDHVAFLLGQAG